VLPTNVPAVYILFVGMCETNRWSSLGWQPLVGGILRLGTYILGESQYCSLFCFIAVEKLTEDLRVGEGRCTLPCWQIYEIAIMKRSSHSCGLASLPARLALRNQHARTGVEAFHYRGIFRFRDAIGHP
jgi:hypothetical protein